MTTQVLLDFTDVIIVASFFAATLSLIVYLWRHGRSASRHDRLS